MALQELRLDLPPSACELTEQEARFVAACDACSEAICEDSRNRHTRLVRSDPAQFVQVMRSLDRASTFRGNRFCEWGCGVGTVTGLAAIAGYDAMGIEIDPVCVAEADALASRFELNARFSHGSFVPPFLKQVSVFGSFGATRWEITAECDAYEALGCEIAEIDIVYAYPWPREIELYERLFDQVAEPEAVLWLYRKGQSPRLLRKMPRGEA